MSLKRALLFVMTSITMLALVSPASAVETGGTPPTSARPVAPPDLGLDEPAVTAPVPAPPRPAAPAPAGSNTLFSRIVAGAAAIIPGIMAGKAAAAMLAGSMPALATVGGLLVGGAVIAGGVILGGLLYRMFPAPFDWLRAQLGNVPSMLGGLLQRIPNPFSRSPPSPPRAAGVPGAPTTPGVPPPPPGPGPGAPTATPEGVTPPMPATVLGMTAAP